MITKIERSGNILNITKEVDGVESQFSWVIPYNLQDEKVYTTKDGRIFVGQYRYNEQTGAWDKVNKILLLLLKIWNAITEVFAKKDNDIKVGDKVMIVNYGHLMYIHKNILKEMMIESELYPIIYEDVNNVTLDKSPELVGKTGVVSEIKGDFYALDGVPGKSAWYNRDQLKLI